MKRVWQAAGALILCITPHILVEFKGKSNEADESTKSAEVNKTEHVACIKLLKKFWESKFRFFLLQSVDDPE